MIRVDGSELFRIAKQRVGDKKDVVGVNAENECSDSIDASKVEGAVRRIEVEEVRCALNHENQESEWAVCGFV